jgi:hypothetical protein
MRRTILGCIVIFAFLVAPLAAEAQPARKVARIGYLAPGTATASAWGRKAFTDGSRDRIARSSADDGRWDASARCPRGRIGAAVAVAGHQICDEHARGPGHAWSSDQALEQHRTHGAEVYLVGMRLYRLWPPIFPPPAV